MSERLINSLSLLLTALLLAGLPILAQESSDARFTVHVVQRGENLFRIALQYDRFAEEIAEANGITDSDSIVIGQRLIIPLPANSPQERITHVVAAGETLASIATAYDKTVSQLMVLNSLASRDLIYVGQELTIVDGDPIACVETLGSTQPSAPNVGEAIPIPAIAPEAGTRHSFSRTGDPSQVYIHTVQSGETLSEIGLRYNQTIDALARVNNMADPGLLSVGQRLVVPGIRLPQLTRKLPDSVLAFTIDPLVFSAGRSGRVELLTSKPVTISGKFMGRELRVIAREDGKRHNILIGIPMFTELNVYPMTLQLQDEFGQSTPIDASVQVIAGGYGRQTIRISDSELLAPAVEEEETALLALYTGRFTDERSWINSLSLPAAAPINAVFGTLRSYNGSPFDRYHGGVDFAGAPGTSILAAADGEVIMVNRLHIRGNTTLIDHGWGLYTLYAHQDETLVQLGEAVATGQVIGTVGSTGRSTGPHLHWEAWLNGVNIDPMQWVQEVFP
ncbi:MAG: LysM peptidoglycan-binding domain-containing protein [Chloroflexi bacterium]|nr:LysM peptidoglycan-binding domain-containing protein [Chloroflexota bacterium]